jgi:hypothetical protein
VGLPSVGETVVKEFFRVTWGYQKVLGSHGKTIVKKFFMGGSWVMEKQLSKSFLGTHGWSMGKELSMSFSWVMGKEFTKSFFPMGPWVFHGKTIVRKFFL